MTPTLGTERTPYGTLDAGTGRASTSALDAHGNLVPLTQEQGEDQVGPPTQKQGEHLPGPYLDCVLLGNKVSGILSSRTSIALVYGASMALGGITEVLQLLLKARNLGAAKA